MKLSIKKTLLVTSAVLLAACSSEAAKSIDDYKGDDAARNATIARCQQDVKSQQEDGNCLNAKAAAEQLWQEKLDAIIAETDAIRDEHSATRLKCSVAREGATAAQQKEDAEKCLAEFEESEIAKKMKSLGEQSRTHKENYPVTW